MCPNYKPYFDWIRTKSVLWVKIYSTQDELFFFYVRINPLAICSWLNLVLIFKRVLIFLLTYSQKHRKLFNTIWYLKINWNSKQYLLTPLCSNSITCRLYHYQYRTNIYKILLAYFTTFLRNTRLIMTGDEGVDGVDIRAPA